MIFGFVFIFNAYRYGKPYIVAPFEYVFLIWAVLLGWFIWSETVSSRNITPKKIPNIGIRKATYEKNTAPARSIT